MDNTDWFNYGGSLSGYPLYSNPETFIRNFQTQLKPGKTNRVFAVVEWTRRGRCCCHLSHPGTGDRAWR